MRDRHDVDGGMVGDPFIAAFAFQSASCRALIARTSASARGIRTPVWELDPSPEEIPRAKKRFRLFLTGEHTLCV
jgi:hypothetical protein